MNRFLLIEAAKPENSYYAGELKETYAHAIIDGRLLCYDLVNNTQYVIGRGWVGIGRRAAADRWEPAEEFAARDNDHSGNAF